MAKIRHNNIIDTVDEVFSLAKDKGSLHLYADDYQLDGRYLSFNGLKTLHFGTCGYLGLEHHPLLKSGAIEAIERYGTQFPMSKTYVSNPLYTELEYLIETMYGAPVVISKNCTLSHQAVIPTIVRQSDLIILDHQVHTSVQEAVKKLLSQGVTVEMIRHSNLEMLEDRVKKNQGKYEKIWYMADGIYSMYGDLAPIKELTALADKYDQLHLYVDDAHGMSWAGQNGTGYVMSQMDGLHEKMILTATLGKAFGSCGGLTLFPNKEWQRKVKTFGGPLTFSVQMEPAVLGAAVASAKVHLSEDIYTYQEELQKKITYCNELIKRTDLPLIKENVSPIFYIGTGTMEIGNKLIARLIEDGIYVNLAPFPGVPAKNTGARVTISRNNRTEDIEQLVDKLDIHLNQALEEGNNTKAKIWQAFKITPPKMSKETNQSSSNNVKMDTRIDDSIVKIDEDLWNEHIGHRGMFDWAGMKFLEDSFNGNAKEESNWAFRYFTIRNSENKILLMTFFVIALYKEDMFSEVSISKSIEEQRVDNPYYFTSKAIIMGSLFTEGNHLFLNRKDPNWKSALSMMLDELYKEQEIHQAKNIILRDFDAGDQEMNEFMIEQSFVKIDMPESCVFDNLNWKTEEQFLEVLSKKSKRHYKQKVKKFGDYYDVQVKVSLDKEELNHAIKLFQNVKDNNHAINSFDFPNELFQQMNKDPHWEFLMLYLKVDEESLPRLVSVGFCHRNSADVYSPMLIGMDYDFVLEYGVYRQALYQMIKRAVHLKSSKVNFGISATIEKQRIGSKINPKVAYFQAKDNYETEMMGATIALKKS